MTRTRLSLLTTTALASTLGVALPAFAQAPAQMYAPAPAPAPMYAPAPAQAQMYAPVPAPAPEVVAPAPAPVAVAPKAADDMTGSVGFGVGVDAGINEWIKPNTANLMMKYWLSDAMAIVPKLKLNISKTKDVNATWEIDPSVLADFTLLKGASTRLSAGVGLGLGFGKDPSAAASVPAGETSKTHIEIFVPVQIGVEHFFTRWFAMGIAANFKLIDFAKQGDPWTMKFALDNATTYMGSLFFYTD